MIPALATHHRDPIEYPGVNAWLAAALANAEDPDVRRKIREAMQFAVIAAEESRP